MESKRINTKAFARAYIAIALFASWGISALTGFLLWAAPTGPRSGRTLLLAGLTKGEWGDVHFWTSVLAIAITVLHIVVDWKTLTACMRYMASMRRGRIECD